MPNSDEQDPPASDGTLYRAPRMPRARSSGDRITQAALAIGAVGVLLGGLFATGVLGGDSDTVLPAAADPVPTSTVLDVTATAPADDAADDSAATEPAPTPAATTASPPAAGPKVLRTATAGFCLGVKVDHEPDKAPAELAGCTGGPEQQWVATPVDGDLVTLVNAVSGRCLDIEADSADDGASLQQFPCHGRGNQQWRLVPAGTGPVLLISVRSGKCAQARNGGTGPGAELEQMPCTGAPEQQWTVS